MANLRFDFRLWKQDRYFYPQAVEQLQEGSCKPNALFLTKSEDSDSGMRFFDDEVEGDVEQCTCMVDCNGTTIWEGDLVRLKNMAELPSNIDSVTIYSVYSGKEGVVAWTSGAFCLCYPSHDSEFAHVLARFSSENLEVVGNIHTGIIAKE